MCALVTGVQTCALPILPSAVWNAIDRTGWKPKVEYPPIRFVRFSSRALKEGVKRHLIDGIEVPIFEPAKTIVDCFRYRNKIGLDIELEGLRDGLRTKRATPDQLWEFARTASVWSVMRPRSAEHTSELQSLMLISYAVFCLTKKQSKT